MKRHYHESAKRSLTNLPVINSMLKKRFAEDQFYKMHNIRILSFESGEPRPPVPDHDFLCLYKGAQIDIWPPHLQVSHHDTVTTAKNSAAHNAITGNAT